MCGRYRFTFKDAKWLADQMGISMKEAMEVLKSLSEADDRWNVPPGSSMPPPLFLRPEAGAPVTMTLSIPWGIHTGPYFITCAREDNAVKHKANLTHRRCLIPMGGYYEWFRITPKKKIPHDISLPDGEPFCVAGIHGPWQSPGKTGRGFAVITCEPGPDIAWLHDRLPIIVPRDRWQDWLRDDLSFDDVVDLTRKVLVPAAQSLHFRTEALPLPSGRGSETISSKPPQFSWWTPSAHAVLRTVQQLVVHNQAPAAQADIESDCGVDAAEFQHTMLTLQQHEMIHTAPVSARPEDGMGWVVNNEISPGHEVTARAQLLTAALQKHGPSKAEAKDQKPTQGEFGF